MPGARKDLEEFLEQLERLPGGPAAAVPDFFGPWLAGEPEAHRFQLKDGGELALEDDGRLIHRRDGGETLILHLDAKQQTSIHELATPAMPALPLALVGIALGALEDGRRLKKTLPKLDGAARDLMLMTVCRLCG